VALQEAAAPIAVECVCDITIRQNMYTHWLAIRARSNHYFTC
jgi:hypothetical protein